MSKVKKGCRLLARGKVRKGDFVHSYHDEDWQAANGLIGWTISKAKESGFRVCRPNPTQRSKASRPRPKLSDIVKFCIDLQDNCHSHLDGNVKATAFLKKFKLSGVGSLHQKLTGNPDSAYTVRN